MLAKSFHGNRNLQDGGNDGLKIMPSRKRRDTAENGDDYFQLLQRRGLDDNDDGDNEDVKNLNEVTN